MHWPFTKRKPGRPATARIEDVRLARAIRARFDAARTTSENRRHWLHADALSADAAASPAVRATLRNRARYETANNCYAKGIVLTLAEDLVGTGPRLQMLLGDPKANHRIEREFGIWASAVHLAAKLRAMRKARATDGEAFALLVTNPRHGHPVRLDVKLVEADQVTTPNWTPSKAQPVDGIVFDAWDNPAEYHLLEAHPGGPVPVFAQGYRRVTARNCLHWFRADRASQSRGIPDLTPALPLFALMRRYTLATVSAAETAAEFATFFKTNFPSGGEAAGSEETDGQGNPLGLGGLTMEIERNMGTYLPDGWDVAQLKAEQPSTTYPDFKGEIISEIARCLQIPRNIAALDSSKHNYASGRLDHQIYMRSVRVEQSDMEIVVLDPILAAWLAEAKRVPGLIPTGAWMDEADPHGWFWHGIEEVDPRWAKAKVTLVKSGLLSEAEYHAARGRDWEEEQVQREREALGRQKRNLREPADIKAVGFSTEDLVRAYVRMASGLPAYDEEND